MTSIFQLVLCQTHLFLLLMMLAKNRPSEGSRELVSSVLPHMKVRHATEGWVFFINMDVFQITELRMNRKTSCGAVPFFLSLCALFIYVLVCVWQVFNDHYVLVQMDDMRDEAQKEGGGRSFLCHRDSPGIFPTQWSLKNGVKLSPPPGLYV